MSKKTKLKRQFKFEYLDTLGSLAAEEDAEFAECFHDLGLAEVLLSVADRRSIVVGRTGAGKTRWLQFIASRAPTRSIWLDPDAVSLHHLTNSAVLRTLHESGVNLDMFFKLLWRHVIAVEVLRRHCQIDSPDSFARLFDKLGLSDSSRRRNQALLYLQNWGNTFWQSTDQNVRAIATKIENEIGAKARAGGFELSASRSHTEEEKSSIRRLGQEFISTIQAKELTELLGVLDAVVDDQQKPYYVLIDRLDEAWADDPIRHRMLRALVEAIRDFRSVRHIKILASFREDMLLATLRATAQGPIQREKYESLLLPLRWASSDLREMINVRLQRLVSRKGVEGPSEIGDVLVGKAVGSGTLFDYVVERTLLRPRDVIAFVNAAIAASVGESVVKLSTLRSVETGYSRKRLEALEDEWRVTYPSITEVCASWPRRRRALAPSEVDNEDFVSNLWVAVSRHLPQSQPASADPLARALDEYAGKKSGSRVLILREYFRIAYEVGFVGVQFGKQLVHSVDGTMLPSSTDEEFVRFRFTLHPTFWAALDVSRD